MRVERVRSFYEVVLQRFAGDKSGIEHFTA